MAILPKERLGEVVPISFGDTNRSTPETRAWVVGGGGTAPDGGDVNHSHPQATAAEQQPRAHVEVSEPISQPSEPPCSKYRRIFFGHSTSKRFKLVLKMARVRCFRTQHSSRTIRGSH